jgi:hypothetical protein
MNFFRKLFKFDSDEGDVVFNPETAPDPERKSPETAAGIKSADILPAEQGAAQAEIEAIRNELKPEKFEKEVKTVEDFIDCLKWSYDNAQNEDDKGQLAHQIIKIEVGLRTAGFSAGDVQVEQMEDKTLGTYNPQDRKVAVSADLLADFKADRTLFELVFVHEGLHKGKDGKELLSEGLTQIRTEQIVGTETSVYDREVAMAKRVFFKTGITKAIKGYNIDDPHRLANPYFEIEIKSIQNKLRNKFQELTAVRGKKPEEAYKLLLRSDDIMKMKSGFKEVVEELYDKLGDEGADKIILESMKKILK